MGLLSISFTILELKWISAHEPFVLEWMLCLLVLLKFSMNNFKNTLEENHPFSSLCMNFVAEAKLSMRHLKKGFADACLVALATTAKKVPESP